MLTLYDKSTADFWKSVKIRRYYGSPSPPLIHPIFQPHSPLKIYRPLILKSLVTSPPPGMGEKYCYERVCMSVSLSVRSRISITTHVETSFLKFSVRVIRVRGSVLLWRQRNTLCTSGLRMTSCFPIMGLWRVALSVSSAVLEQVVRNFKRIPQVASYFLTSSSYTMTANCVLGALAMTWWARPWVGGLQCSV